MKHRTTNVIAGVLLSFSLLVSCTKDEDPAVGMDINSATRVSVDRFSAIAGHLMVRTNENGLPGANVPINFDQPPFITTGFDRTGAVTSYYNFDIQPTTPDEIYVFFEEGSTTPINGQNNIINTIPGDPGYNDFWVVNTVTVPDNYVVNSLTSEADVLASGFPITKTTNIVNCPVVPFGSTASRSFSPGIASALTLGWYKDQAVAYFNFGEAPLSATSNGMVPISPIYVMFNDNAAGPASGFYTEVDNPSQTHNILATIPGDANYSPLWNVFVIDNIHFDAVSNLATALSFSNTAAGATVNCPIVK
jgi:hypothetical protein